MAALPKIIGILNVTTDSMSSFGRCADPLEATDFVRKIIDDGASIIDVGAESTRPGGMSVTHEQEWARLEPVLQKIIDIAHNAGVEISLDTRNHETASKGVRIGIDYINDVCGFADEKMVDVLAKHHKVKGIFMHSLAVPVPRSCCLPYETDVAAFLIKWGVKKLAHLVDDHNISADRLIFDPGLGFSKDEDHCFDIVRNIEIFKKALGVPICIGHSKKRFLGQQLNSDDRGTETLALSIVPPMLQADYIRVHDVREHKKAFDIIARFYSH